MSEVRGIPCMNFGCEARVKKDGDYYCSGIIIRNTSNVPSGRYYAQLVNSTTEVGDCDRVEALNNQAVIIAEIAYTKSMVAKLQ